MSAIKHTDLFDFPAYEAAIKSVQNETKKFGNDMEGIIKRLKADQKGLNADLAQYAEILRNFSVAVTGAGSKLKQFAKEVEETKRRRQEFADTEKVLTAVMQGQKTTVAELQSTYKQLDQQLKSLDVNSENYAKEQQKILSQVQQVVPAIQAYSTALRQARDSARTGEGTIKQMRERLAELKQQFINMPAAVNPATGALNRNNAAAVALQKEINQLDNAVKKADAQMGIFSRNVGNYSGAINRGFKSFAGSFVAALGVGTAFEAARGIFDINRQFDQLNEATRIVTGSQEEFAQSQLFLTDVAQKYGLQIIDLTKAYNKFYASSVNAGLTADQTRKIFDQVSKVAANLKLSQDEVNGVFTAFAQIAGKGKVQAEELRGQIGERIPAAASIAARALGITEKELSKLLEKGEVYALDFLPKFAAELEKTFGKQEEINTLTAAINRFFNTVQTAVESERLTSFLAASIDLADRLVKALVGVGDELFGITNDILDKNYSFGEIFTGKALRDLVSGDLTKDRKDREAATEQEKARLRSINAAKADFAKQDKAFQNEQLKAQVALTKEAIKTYEYRFGIFKSNSSPFVKDDLENLKLQTGILNAFNEVAFGKKPTPQGPTKTGKDNSGKVADSAQRLLKQELDAAILQQELYYQQGLQSEEQFQIKKLDLIQQYVDKAIEVEKGLGKNQDSAEIQELNNVYSKGLVEFQKFYNRKRGIEESEAEKSEALRLKQEQKDMDYMDRVMEQDAQLILNRKAIINREKEKEFQDAEDAIKQSFALQAKGRDTNLSEELRYLAELKKNRIKYNKDITDIELAEERIREQAKRELRQQATETVIQGLQAIVDATKASSDARFENIFNNLEKEKDAELAAAGNNAVAREAIEKKFDEKIKQQKIKQAQADKRFALYNIALNTATSVAKTFATFGWPLGIPLAALAVAQGAIQAAVVASRPLPQFRKGTKSAPKGPAIVGEEGPELIERDGQMFVSPGKPTLVNLKGRERIYTARETQRIFARAEKDAEIGKHNGSVMAALNAANGIAVARQEVQKEIMRESMRSNEKVLGRMFDQAVSKIPQPITIWDARGVRSIMKRKNERRESLNNRLSR
jgi:tape measure domain-containing protein